MAEADVLADHHEQLGSAFFAVVDFDLDFGRVVHDYLTDPAVWG